MLCVTDDEFSDDDYGAVHTGQYTMSRPHIQADLFRLGRQIQRILMEEPEYTLNLCKLREKYQYLYGQPLDKLGYSKLVDCVYALPDPITTRNMRPRGVVLLLKRPYAPSCKLFQVGKCQKESEKCEFEHECDLCGYPSHGAYACNDDDAPGAQLQSYTHCCLRSKCVGDSHNPDVPVSDTHEILLRDISNKAKRIPIKTMIAMQSNFVAPPKFRNPNLDCIMQRPITPLSQSAPSPILSPTYVPSDENDDLIFRFYTHFLSWLNHRYENSPGWPITRTDFAFDWETYLTSNRAMRLTVVAMVDFSPAEALVYLSGELRVVVVHDGTELKWDHPRLLKVVKASGASTPAPRLWSRATDSWASPKQGQSANSSRAASPSHSRQTVSPSQSSWNVSVSTGKDGMRSISVQSNSNQMANATSSIKIPVPVPSEYTPTNSNTAPCSSSNARTSEKQQRLSDRWSTQSSSISAPTLSLSPKRSVRSEEQQELSVKRANPNVANAPVAQGLDNRQRNLPPSNQLAAPAGHSSINPSAQEWRPQGFIKSTDQSAPASKTKYSPAMTAPPPRSAPIAGQKPVSAVKTPVSSATLSTVASKKPPKSDTQRVSPLPDAGPYPIGALSPLAPPFTAKSESSPLVDEIPISATASRHDSSGAAVSVKSNQANCSLITADSVAPASTSTGGTSTIEQKELMQQMCDRNEDFLKNLLFQAVVGADPLSPEEVDSFVAECLRLQGAGVRSVLAGMRSLWLAARVTPSTPAGVLFPHSKAGGVSTVTESESVKSIDNVKMVSPSTLAQFLMRAELSSWIDRFNEEEITFDVLSELSNGDLVKLGMSNAKERKKFHNTVRLICLDKK
uniref:SAM domain-containing protein n=1 Tax=Spongospora subterranea TaxID=70186 RepID=A0A0H5QGD6_9EUKA|eukprot:CRZ01010.1 hypothetical protein [Spongospora subterranea]